MKIFSFRYIWLRVITTRRIFGCLFMCSWNEVVGATSSECFQY